MGAVERVRELVRPIVEDAGVVLYDIEHEAGVLRIALDREGGIDVDTIGELSTAISRALDERDPFPDQRYLLEVTSPGVERKLRTPEHFAKQVGEDVNVKVRATVDGQRRFSARLVSVDAEGIEVQIEGTADGELRRLAYDDIESARTIFHWGEQAPPGRANANSTTKKAATR